MLNVHPQHPLTTPSITIISYTAESDVVYAPNHKIESRHRRINQYFCKDVEDVLKTRCKAFGKVLQEEKRLKKTSDSSADKVLQCKGLLLFFDYKLNEFNKGKKDKVYRFYLLDGEDVSQTEFLSRMQTEGYFLIDAGVDYVRKDVPDDAGRVFWMCQEGII